MVFELLNAATLPCQRIRRNSRKLYPPGFLFVNDADLLGPFS